MLCTLILYISSEPYSLKSTPNDKFLRNSSGQFYLLSEFLPEIYWEESAEEIFFSYFILLEMRDLTYKHTYILNWPLQLSSQDYGLASHTTHVVCVNFIH